MSDIAVTVIGGYLGAGKTTLLNHVLRSADERIAVLVNDFGDINIDEALIESNDGDTIALTNGCICCSLVDGFGEALRTIRGLEPRPARLVIEASGVADPASVAAWGHGPGFELDSTVVVADAETVQHKAEDAYVGDTIRAQLRAADIVVLNKVDLVDGLQLAATRSWLESQCPEAVIVEAVDAVVDPLLLFGATHRSGTGHSTHLHADELFETWTWRPDEEPVARATIEAMMRELPESVVRAKGVIWLAESPDVMSIVQRVGRRWSVRRGKAIAPGDSVASRIVFVALGNDALGESESARSELPS